MANLSGYPVATVTAHGESPQVLYSLFRSIRALVAGHPSQRSVVTFTCPHCGSDVPVTAAACRECGSDDETGWSAKSDQHAEGYDDEFDYDEFVANEFPDSARHASGPQLRTWVIRIVILLMCLATLLQMF